VHSFGFASRAEGEAAELRELIADLTNNLSDLEDVSKCTDDNAAVPELAIAFGAATYRTEGERPHPVTTCAEVLEVAYLRP